MVDYCSGRLCDTSRVSQHSFNILGWKNLKCQQQLQRATMVYRSLHGLAGLFKFSIRKARNNILPAMGL